MKNILLISLLGVVGCTSPQPAVEPVTRLDSVSGATSPRQVSSEKFVYDQRPLPGQPVLIAPEQAQTVIQQFKESYAKMGNPRMLIYVNRELVDEKTGMKLVARTEKTDATRRNYDSTVEANPSSNSVNINAGGNVAVNGSSIAHPGKGKISDTTENVSNENRYRIEEHESKLADRQTVRDVERLFGRPLRAGGASLADQRVATQMIADRKIESFVVNPEGEAARKDREALSKIADVVIEILISSRNIVVPEISSDKTYTMPDIQATAIRLEDSKILGQASSRDVLGKDRYAGNIVRNFDVQEIAEATALALMEDLARD